MTERFLDRDGELEALGRAWRGSTARLLVVYGRRRVGKTELLRRFSEGRRAVFFVADQRASGALLRDFASRLAELEETPPEVTPQPSLAGWEDAFRHAGRLGWKKRLAVVLDEFPYLVEAAPEVPSVLQKVWDEALSRSRVLLVLCGSAVSFMEREILAEKSPLFGRRDAQLHLEPLGLADAAGFWPAWTPEDRIRAYSIVGGMPAYARRFHADRTLRENVIAEILDKNGALYEEARSLLRQELRVPRVYFAILGAIASGRTTQNECGQAAGLKGNEAGPYLRTLMDLRLVTRVIPVSERHPDRSRKGTYRIADPYLRFWFRFVAGNVSRLEQGLADSVWSQAIAPQLDHHVSGVFEDVAAAHVWRMARLGQMPFVPERIGPWYARDEEVEVVAVGPGRREILVGECKWTSNPVGAEVIATLDRRAAQVTQDLGAQTAHLVLFSRAELSERARADADRLGVEVIRPRDLFSRRRAQSTGARRRHARGGEDRAGGLSEGGVRRKRLEPDSQP